MFDASILLHFASFLSSTSVYLHLPHLSWSFVAVQPPKNSIFKTVVVPSDRQSLPINSFSHNTSRFANTCERVEGDFK